MLAPNETTLIAVGLDVGSQNARLFLAPQKLSQEPSIVANEIGQRYTLAISTAEPDVESDPMNDQYWDANNKKSKLDSLQKKETHYLYGDAARKSLQRMKQPLAPNTILNMVQLQNDEGKEDPSDAMTACASFFQHLTNLTSNASHTDAQSLRFVVCTSPDESGSPALTNLSTALQQGILQSITEEGFKKADKKEIFNQKRILSFITHPVAIAHAHNLFEEKSKRNILVVDWGASALSLTNLSITAGMAQIQDHKEEASLSGKNVVTLLVKHIAELFERKNRGVPPGEVLSNKKAKAKLEVAAEDALRSFGYSPKVTITIDGLFEGMDCQVDVMLARFEMLMGNILRNAEGKLKAMQGGAAGESFDVVIGAGSIMRMKCVEKMMNRLFPKEQVARGESANVVPPEEAAAMGCAVYGATCISSKYNMDEDNDGESGECNLVDEEVLLSPVGIGLSFVEGDAAACILIDRGTPLPALVTKMVDITGCSSNSLDIVQMNDGEKVIGRLEGVGDNGKKEVEITVELSDSGDLSIAVNGGQAVNL
eukprot:scaffold1035_cov265-Chaetoceros_neogracile.AAC.4